ncbi:uncharacterized protein TRIVIDRAFT_28900 [Trichoderma virens Gv29-8]|uniref:Zn(2)-C6 fungal-type domain-containing protein n=1 Tax=Hypocrea virens (strain Gv29-8 / FGSC 10586) TaxID=413071 RepID=G9MT40_HYPVG|nr:uncharacterized protein TRIVIDRAFT_28900 [Trichoderma virens Gv29-8]EHK23082.1 hypothetical protein TRIVIDRAFT_28900 [Trichoderma virens Gv29-8]
MSESNVSADPGDYNEASAERMGGSRPAPRGTASYNRRRAVKACQVCRARRTKCDNQKPSCSFCLKVGAKCIQSPVDLSTFDPASLKILERLDELDRTMKTLASRTDPKQTRFSSDLSKTASSSIPIELIPPGPEYIMTWGVFGDLGQGVAAIGLSESGPATSCNQYPLQSPSSPKSDLTAELDLCRVNHLLDNFFNYAHVKNPILDEQAARRMVQSIILHGIDWSAESCLTLLICALGCIARPFGPTLDTMPGTSAYVSAETLFHAAQRRIGIAFSSEDIISTQCLFLSGVYMMCIFQPTKAWRFFLQALASCQQPSFLNSLSPPTSSTTCDGSPASHSLETLHQAIYWSSWKSEREMRSYLRPTDFTLTEEELAFYPPFLPTPPNLHLEQELEANGDSCVTRQTVSWYFYLAEISLRRLASNLYTEMLRFCEQSFSSQGTLEALVGAVPHYEEQAQEWISSLPFCLLFDAPAEEDDICRFVLRGHAINLYEMIYWPFLSAYLMKDFVVEETQGFLPSASWNIRRLAQKALDYHALRLSVNKPGYRHRHHGTLLLIQSCSRSALVLVAAALRNITNTAQNSAKGAIVLKLPNGWRVGLDETIDMLAFWENESRQLASIRHVLQAARQKIQ